MLRGGLRLAKVNQLMPRGARATSVKADVKADAYNNRVILDRGVMKKAKDCALCGRVMTWRKKWERDWDEVKYCSQKCKGQAKQAAKRERGKAECAAAEVHG